MFSPPENHPILLRSHDSGEHWELAADLVSSLGENPFELVAIDPVDEDRLYARILGASAETLAISEDGGLTFVQSVSIPGKLNAFLKLASGTILVGGTAGNEALAYRSRDGARSFEPWPEAPHVHALAERHGKLYVAADNFADGYALAESDDEGAHLRPLTGFQHVRAVKGCAANLCAERCAYYASIRLWPVAVCAASSPAAEDDPANPTDLRDTDAPAAATSADAGADGPARVDPKEERPTLRPSRSHSACDLVDNRHEDSWSGLLALGLLVSAACRIRRPSRDKRAPGATTGRGPPLAIWRLGGSTPPRVSGG